MLLLLLLLMLMLLWKKNNIDAFLTLSVYYIHTESLKINDHNTSSTAQGGGGSFKDRKPIGDVRELS